MDLRQGRNSSYVNNVIVSTFVLHYDHLKIILHIANVKKARSRSRLGFAKEKNGKMKALLSIVKSMACVCALEDDVQEKDGYSCGL